VIPYTDYELELKLQELYEGRSFVLPSSEDHAYQMLFIAQCYLNDRKQETFDALAKEYK
jgi:hypothetical protein